MVTFDNDEYCKLWTNVHSLLIVYPFQHKLNRKNFGGHCELPICNRISTFFSRMV